MDNDEQLLLPNMGSGLQFNKKTENTANEGFVISHVGSGSNEHRYGQQWTQFFARLH
jgi:hypothetical protein